MIMGLLWLSAVPLAGGTVAVVFGVGNPPMLNASWFPFHPVGAFLGEWLGGYPCDATGSHQLVWVIAVGLSIAAPLNLTVPETGRSATRADGDLTMTRKA